MTDSTHPFSASSFEPSLPSHSSDSTVQFRRRNPQLRQLVTEASQRVTVSSWSTSTTKRWIDSLLASIALLLLLPVMLLVAFAVRLDSKGPVLFVQYRTGYRGRRFKFYKFRSMVTDAEARKHTLAHLNKHGSQSVDFKVERDPRITRVGQFIRKTSLDELPNLWSVVRGDMRLVGPRPTSFCASNYDDEHLRRLVVYPGITGLWQVSGRSDIDFDERVELDAEYAAKASFWYDLALILQTPVAVIRQAGAS